MVSFRLQNQMLYVFDVDDTKHQSDVINPEVIVDAYPVINGFGPFDILSGARNYILIDPSAGKNDFGVS